MNHAHITTLQAFALDLQQAHWKADTKSNEHRTLGDLYEKVVDLTDTLAEVVMGKEGNTNLPVEQFKAFEGPVSDLLSGALNTIAQARGELKSGEDDCLLNILADFDAAIYRAKYLLKV